MKKVWAIVFKGELNRLTVSREEMYLIRPFRSYSRLR